MKNREIKFRIWDIDQRDFINSAYSKIHVKNKILNLEFPDYWIIQEFTGLLDKNGREIYEGDLLNFAVKGAAHGREREKYENQEVYYDEELACFMFGKNYTKTGDYWGHCMLDEIDKGTIEVVGNIFEKKL